MVLVLPFDLEHSFHILANSTNYIKNRFGERSRFEKYIFYYLQYLRKQIRKNYIYIPILNKEDINDLLIKLKDYITIEKCNMSPGEIREYLLLDFNSVRRTLMVDNSKIDALKNILFKIINYNVRQDNLVKLNDILLILFSDTYYYPEKITFLVFNNFYFMIENNINLTNPEDLLEIRTHLIDINSNYLVLKIKIDYNTFLYYIFDYFLQQYEFNGINDENDETIEILKEKCEEFILHNSIKLNNEKGYCFEIAKLIDELNFKLNHIYYTIPYREDYWIHLIEKEMMLNTKSEKKVMTKLDYRGFKDEIVFDFYFDYNYLTPISTYYLSVI